ncbi:MAG: hypothetical protein ACXWJW_04545 [Xanthobacteraceae bacterium]
MCKHCGRDLKVPKPLMEENAELIARVEKLEIELGALRSAAARKSDPLAYWSTAYFYFVLPATLLLLLAHYLIIIHFDLNPLLLRVLSVVIPLPFGFALRFVTHHGLRSAAIVGAATGIIAVFLMMVVVGLVDKVPIVPDTARDWRETIEYMVSIALAVVTGNILALAIFRVLPKTMSGKRAPNPLAMRIAVLMGAGVGKNALRRRAEKIENLMHSLTAAGAAFGTAAGSLYTGMRALLPTLTS